MLRDAKEAARVLSVASAARRDDALKAMAEILGQNVAEIVAANGEDLARGVAEGMSEGLQVASASPPSEFPLSPRRSRTSVHLRIRWEMWCVE